MIKVWLDCARAPEEKSLWLHNIDDAKQYILQCEREYADLFTKEKRYDIDLLPRYWNIDDKCGLELLQWLEKTYRVNYTFKLHVAESEEIKAIIERNAHRGWRLD